MRTLPLRVRLVAGFSLAMLLVLVAADAFVYWRVQYALDRGLDTDLVAARRSLEDGVRASGRVDAGVEEQVSGGALGAVFQVLDARGAVLQRGPGTPATPLVAAGRLGDGAHVNVGALLPVSPDPLRVLVTRVPVSGGDPVYLVVGVGRARRDEALRELLAQLAVASLGALVVTGFVGDRLARSALHPVERYRRRAEQVAAGASGVRLDVPDGRDDEVTRLGHTLNDMLDALDRAVAAERRFVDDASHELRTPLTVLTSRIQLAQRRERTVAEHEAVLAELAVDVERLRTLADQLLQLGGPHTGEVTADAGAVVAAVAAAHEPPPGLRLPERPVAVAVPELALTRVVENLLRNAELHGAPPVTVALTAEPAASGGGALLVVADAGPGMSEELLGRATERFARADDARSRPGSGLGLAIVADLVSRAGGRLELRNRPGGFEVRVRLPG